MFGVGTHGEADDEEKSNERGYVTSNSNQRLELIRSSIKLLTARSVDYYYYYYFHLFFYFYMASVADIGLWSLSFPTRMCSIQEILAAPMLSHVIGWGTLFSC